MIEVKCDKCGGTEFFSLCANCNAELMDKTNAMRDALERVAKIYEDNIDSPIANFAGYAYAMRCIARSAIGKEAGG